MSSVEKKHLELTLKPCMKKLGFKKKGGTWHRVLENYIQVVNIQGSQFSKNFYINLGIYIRALGDSIAPAEYDCHIRIRLNSFIKNSEINNLLNYEDFSPDEVQREKLNHYIKNEGMEWLNKCSTHEGAKEEYVLPNRIMTKFQKDALNTYFANK